MTSTAFKRNALVAAIALGSAAMIAPSIGSAAPVGNFATSSDNRWSVTIGVEHSRRDMEQRGETRVGSESLLERDILVSEVGEVPVATEYESISGIDAREDHSDLFAQINFSVTPRIELYGRLGASRTRLSGFSDFDNHWTTRVQSGEGEFTQRESTRQPGDELSSGRTNTGWVAAVGGKFNLHEWEAQNAALNLDVMYQWRDADASWNLASDNGGGDRLDIDGYSSEEWHAALVVERTTGSFRPYGGIKYSRIKSDYDVVRSSSWSSELDGQSDTLSMRNQRELGFVGGMEQLVSDNLSFVGEVRAGDETALNLGMRYRFQ